MAQLRWTSLSYKNHKRFRKDESEWAVVYNNHEPIISQELWDKVKERKKSVAQGRKTKIGYTHPLSGFLFCADCGNKMKLCTSISRKGTRLYHFDCGHHIRYGKAYCFSHFISAKVVEEIVLGDIREMAQRIVLDEKAVREDFIRHNAELADQAIKSTKQELQAKRKRTEELSRLMQVAYEDRVRGKCPKISASALYRNTPTSRKSWKLKSQKKKQNLQKRKTQYRARMSLYGTSKNTSKRPSLAERCAMN